MDCTYNKAFYCTSIYVTISKLNLNNMLEGRIQPGANGEVYSQTNKLMVWKCSLEGLNKTSIMDTYLVWN